MAAVGPTCRCLLASVCKKWKLTNIQRCVYGSSWFFITDKYIRLRTSPLSLRISGQTLRIPCAYYHSSYALWNPQGTVRELDDLTYEKLSDVTLDELADFFEDLGDSGLCHKDYDSSLASGVLTIQLGGGNGTYVINKQSPNKQIWLSSPKSGPKRFDIIDGRWRYSRTGEALHDLLAKEFSEQLDTEIDISGLSHARIQSDGDNWA